MTVVTTHTPAPLYRSVPFWILVAGSAAAAGSGAFMLVDTLNGMTTVLLDQTATGVDVYVGQVWAILGAILIGAGALGLGLALTLATLRGLLTRREETASAEDDALGYDPELGYEEDDDIEDDDAKSETVESAATHDEPIVDDQPVTTR